MDKRSRLGVGDNRPAQEGGEPGAAPAAPNEPTVEEVT